MGQVCEMVGGQEAKTSRRLRGEAGTVWDGWQAMGWWRRAARDMRDNSDYLCFSAMEETPGLWPQQLGLSAMGSRVVRYGLTRVGKARVWTAGPVQTRHGPRRMRSASDRGGS